MTTPKQQLVYTHLSNFLDVDAAFWPARPVWHVIDTLGVKSMLHLVAGPDSPEQSMLSPQLGIGPKDLERAEQEMQQLRAQNAKLSAEVAQKLNLLKPEQRAEVTLELQAITAGLLPKSNTSLEQPLHKIDIGVQPTFDQAVEQQIASIQNFIATQTAAIEKTAADLQNNADQTAVAEKAVQTQMDLMQSFIAKQLNTTRTALDDVRMTTDPAWAATQVAQSVNYRPILHGAESVQALQEQITRAVNVKLQTVPAASEPVQAVAYRRFLLEQAKAVVAEANQQHPFLVDADATHELRVALLHLPAFPAWQAQNAALQEIGTIKKQIAAEIELATAKLMALPREAQITLRNDLQASYPYEDLSEVGDAQARLWQVQKSLSVVRSLAAQVDQALEPLAPVASVASAKTEEKKLGTPAPVQVQVAAGDTLYQLAALFTDAEGRPAKWQELQAANPTLQPERLKIGTQLQMPAGWLLNPARQAPESPTQLAQM